MTNNKQQTAVDFAVEKLAAFIKGNDLAISLIKHQAKEMEKERTINFAEDWYFNGSVMMKKIDVKSTIEQHYNETYGENKQ
jgi:hypothetical protein